MGKVGQDRLRHNTNALVGRVEVPMGCPITSASGSYCWPLVVTTARSILQRYRI